MLLLIDTSGDIASVMLSSEGRQLALAENNVARDHSAWLHPAIARILSEGGFDRAAIKAVAVMAGPGSYTGLRVGMAAAKGVCYALGVPLITCNNLLVMAAAMAGLPGPQNQLLCPMIDARRMEVFTALFNRELEIKSPSRALILDKTSFETELRAAPILFSGNGSKKWEEICSSPAASFITQPDVKQSFIEISSKKFRRSDWADTVYSEPEYGKEFQTHEIK